MSSGDYWIKGFEDQSSLSLNIVFFELILLHMFVLYISSAIIFELMRSKTMKYIFKF